MRRLLFVLPALLLALAFPVSAHAQPRITFPTVQTPFVQGTPLLTNTPVTMQYPNGTPATVLIGFKNISAGAQTVVATCYDNNGSASGEIIDIEAPMGPSQRTFEPLGGLYLNFGLTCVLSNVPFDGGIMVYWR
jgi:hypothetical protein